MYNPTLHPLTPPIAPILPPSQLHVPLLIAVINNPLNPISVASYISESREDVYNLWALVSPMARSVAQSRLDKCLRSPELFTE